MVILRHFEGMACVCPCRRWGWEAAEPGEPARTPPPSTWMRRLWQMLQIFTASGYVSRMYCSISRMARLCRVNSPSFCRTERDAAVSQPLACRPLPRPAGPRPRKPSRAGRPSHCRFPPAPWQVSTLAPWQTHQAGKPRPRPKKSRGEVPRTPGSIPHLYHTRVIEVPAAPEQGWSSYGEDT